MAIIKVISKLDPNFERNEIKRVTELANRHLSIIADETVDIIRRNIQVSIERTGSTGNLASGFFKETIPGGYGVGNISELDSKVPYWYWQNFGIARSGRRIPPSSDEANNRGAFQPGNSAPGDGANQRWRTGTGYYPIYPKNPIKAKNYIENTIAEILAKIPSIISKV